MRKLPRHAFEAQFHNHDHYAELTKPDPEWWEVDHKANGGRVDSIDKAANAAVAHALAIARKANAR